VAVNEFSTSVSHTALQTPTK